MSKEFPKYQHLERYGTDDVEGITAGKCYIFPKIDGTNGVVYYEDGEVICTSRNRILGEGQDNQGFKKHIMQNEAIKDFVRGTDLVIYGEFLVPHTIKDYREDAWDKFYVFDVARIVDRDDYEVKYYSFEEYEHLLSDNDIEYVPCQKIIENPTKEDLIKEAKQSTFLLEEGIDFGEGIVVKNYDYENNYGRVVWAKVKTNKFREDFHKNGGTAKVERKSLEQEIVKEYLTEDKVEKIYQKIKSREDGWRSQYIPELLGRSYHDLVKEECWNFVKCKSNPTINFSKLKRFCEKQVKSYKPLLF